MNDTERIIGELKEFKRSTIADLHEIKVAIHSLQNFKWRIAGGAAVLAFVLTGIVELIHMKGN